MKAVVQSRYGAPEKVLRVAEIPAPAPRRGEVLVRVHATSVHPDVWHTVTGRPWVLRLMGAGLWRPHERVPGNDLAGVVEAVGEGVDSFRVGDAVFGATRIAMAWRNGGSFAELAAAPAAALAALPAGVEFAAAAAAATSGFIAWTNLRGGALVVPGARVLVNGAAGGVGSAALQLAVAHGARGTGVDRGAKLDLVRELGAEEAVDFERQDVLALGARFDLVFDVASNLSLAGAGRLLAPGGVYVVIGHDHFGAAQGRILGSLPRMLALLALARLGHRHLPRPTGAQVPQAGEAMAGIAGHLARGELTPLVDRALPLEGVDEAMRRMASGETRGRLVLAPSRSDRFVAGTEIGRGR